MEEPVQKCLHRGCLKSYKESENGEESCVYHPGKPIFHDIKKGWDCCNKTAYDWDEFQKIEGCQRGRHTVVKEETVFWKSNTVNNAQTGLQKAEAGEVKQQPKTIDDFNKQLAEKRQQEQLANQHAADEKKPFVTPGGKHKCANKGCLKEFDPAENTEQACKFHAGAPVFHDIKKYWTCCKTETWDWDEFMKLPTCSVGRHVAKTL